MNVVDSCGWLEYFADGPQAAFFAPAIEDTVRLVVPLIVVFEVSRRLRYLYGPQGEASGMVFLEKGILDVGTLQLMRQAAQAAQVHKLAMADAIIWQTAQVHEARLYTQDADLAGKPGVVYQAKPVSK